MTELRIHGYGGQGVVTLAHLLAQAALWDGLQGQALPSFGVERRGAPVRAVVRVSKDPIHIFSQSRRPQILVLTGGALWDRAFAEGAGDGVRVVLNASAPREGAQTVDAAAIATAHGLVSADGPFINIPIFGAAARAAGLSAAAVEGVLRDRWSGALGDKNVAAALESYRAGEEAAV